MLVSIRLLVGIAQEPAARIDAALLLATFQSVF